ncbi:MAG: hypothetical protein IMX01_05455 [Limnochordaceae bacterium]|nr:hypothetical protein [Limnochordaceae bacterium]
MDIVLTSNSPGEVAGWLTPAVAGLKQVWPQARLTVFLPPCDFASGSEKQVVERLPGVDEVYGPGQYLRYALTGQRPAGFAPGREGFVLFAGGDLFHAAWLGHRLGYPVYAYTEGRAAWLRAIRLWLVPDEESQRIALIRYHAPAQRVRVVGRLMVDAVYWALSTPSGANVHNDTVGWPAAGAGGTDRGRPSAGSWQKTSEPCRLLLLPGSRPAEFQQMLGLFLGAARELAALWQEPSSRCWPAGSLQVGMLLSPFVPPSLLDQTLRTMAEDLAAGRSERWLCPVEGRLRPGRPARQAWQLELAGGLTVSVWQPAASGDRYRLMREATVALGIPGTTTMEMAVLGLPGVIVLPLQRPDLIPLAGLAGSLGRLPGVGAAIRRLAVVRLAQRAGWLAWPNRLSGRECLPELRGMVNVPQVVEALMRLLQEGAEEAAARRECLQAVAGRPGAALRLAQAIAEDWQEQAGVLASHGKGTESIGTGPGDGSYRERRGRPANRRASS